MRQKVLLVGGYLKTRALAESMINQGYQVTIINNSLDNCRSLSEISGVEVIYGDGTKPFVLDEADIDDCDMVIALTQKDYDNLVICQLCSTIHHICKTVALLSDPKKSELFYELGVDLVVCATDMITRFIEQQVMIDTMATMIPVQDNRLSICEIRIPAKSQAVKKSLGELDLPKEVIVGCILRENSSVVPSGATQIEKNDVLVLITNNAKKLSAISSLTREVKA